GQPIIDAARAQQAMRARRGRWLFFIDIAVPRGVATDVGGLENVYLYDVDALEQIVAQNRAGRAREAEQAEALVSAELLRFQAESRVQGVVPTIKALRAHFLDVARAEAQRAIAKLQGATERDRAHQVVAQLAESIVNKLLHAPLTALKREAARAE